MSTAPKPKQFAKMGKAFIGHAIAFKSGSGAEIIMLCPTADDAVRAAEQFGNFKADRKKIKRAALGPVSLLSGAQIAEGE